MVLPARPRKLDPPRCVQPAAATTQALGNKTTRRLLQRWLSLPLGRRL